MNIGNGFLVKTKAEALDEIQSACKGDEVKLIPFPIVSRTMDYYISDKGKVFGCRRHNGFYLVTPLTISKRYRRGPVFKISLGAHKEKEIYLAYALFNVFCSDCYDEHLELEFLDGNTYNTSLSNLKKKEPKISPIFLENLKLFGETYRLYFDKAVHMCLWVGGVEMTMAEAKDVASDAFYEMCAYNKIQVQKALNLWLHICKQRTLDNRWYMGRFESIINTYGEEYLGVNPDYIETGMWQHVKGEKRREYLRWWCTGETPTAVAEITNSTLSSVGSSITRSIQHLQKVYKNDVIIWNQTDRKY